MELHSWQVIAPGTPMEWRAREETPGTGEALIAVEGCGVCHTDLGFFYDGVPPRSPFPLTLGHEISGRVIAVGPGATSWLGHQVVVPAVIPCGRCDACQSGRGAVCPQQVFPGSDLHGGFGTHVRVPVHGLCPVPNLADPLRNPNGLQLADLAVVADAVSTPYQAIRRSGLAAGDLAIMIGVGGIGGFAVQIAAAMGAIVIAIDVNPARLELIQRHGAIASLNSAELDFKSLRAALRKIADEHGIPSWRQRIFEMSGTVPGQELAFGLLGPGATLMVVGYTAEKVAIRLSNLMAFDATAMGNWGCLPEHYPAVVDLVLSGSIALAPFIEHRPMGAINEVFADLHARRLSRRVILIPESEKAPSCN